MLGMLRRVVSGSALLLVVMLAAGSMLSASPLGALLALVALACWGGAGIAVFAGSRWGRILGLCDSAIGFLVGASLALAGTSSPFAGTLFSPADAARWYVVMPMGYIYAALSALAGLLLLAPFGGATIASPGPSDPEGSGSVG